MSTTQTTLAELPALVGRQLGPTPWRTVTQADIDAFAAATGDHQWIHVDVERAADGPFGGTIAHGLLTLSLVPRFLAELLVVTDRRLGINYGYDRVRFPAPVPAGARLRATGELTGLTDLGDGVQTTVTVTVALEGSPKPACVAEAIGRHLR